MTSEHITALDLAEATIDVDEFEAEIKARRVRDSSFWHLPVGTLLGRGRDEPDPGERSPRTHPHLYDDHTGKQSLLTDAEFAAAPETVTRTGRSVSHDVPVTLDARQVMQSEHAAPMRKEVDDYAREHGLDISTETLHDRDGKADVAVHLEQVPAHHGYWLSEIMHHYSGNIYRPRVRNLMETGAADDDAIDDAHEVVKLARSYDLHRPEARSEAADHVAEVLARISSRKRRKLLARLGVEETDGESLRVPYNSTRDAPREELARQAMWSDAHAVVMAAHNRDLDLATLK